MALKRTVGADGVLITEVYGAFRKEESFRLIDDVPHYISNHQLYEIVLISDELEVAQEYPNFFTLQARARSVFDMVERGAIAYVAKSDLVFGLCRQFQAAVDNEHLQLCVFRSFDTAKQWILEMKAE